jgi:hypothetical protein
MIMSTERSRLGEGEGCRTKYNFEVIETARGLAPRSTFSADQEVN